MVLGIANEYSNYHEEFEEAYNQSQAAYKRGFDAEEHYCGICMRDLLGEKFTFLSGCEHFFCTECLTDMAITQINANKAQMIHCAEADCKVPLNDIDMKNLGLSKEMREKYDMLMLKNAIEQMDDMCWCPLPQCGALAVIEKEDNVGRCQHCDHQFFPKNGPTLTVYCYRSKSH